MERIIIAIDDVNLIEELLEEVVTADEKVSVVGGLQLLISDEEKFDNYDVLLDGILANRVTLILTDELTETKRKVASRYAKFKN